MIKGSGGTRLVTEERSEYKIAEDADALLARCQLWIEEIITCRELQEINLHWIPSLFNYTRFKPPIHGLAPLMTLRTSSDLEFR
jgi:hypothetical protein